MRTFTPRDVHRLTGILPEVLRDWRRRGLLDQFGLIVLPNGSTTVDESHPKLKTVDRISWVYRIGDVVALATARDLVELGIDLKNALSLGRRINSKVVAWLRPENKGAKGALLTPRDPRFLLAWPSYEGGPNRGGAALGELQIAVVTDLSQITAHIGPKAIVIDCAEMARSFSAGLREIVQ